MRFGMVGPERDRLAKRRDAGTGLPFLFQCVAEIDVRFRKAGNQRDGLPTGSDGLIELAIVLQKSAEITVRFGKVGPECDCLASGGEGFIELPFPIEGVAEIAVGFSEVRPQGDRLMYQLHGKIIPPRLVGNHCQVVHRVGMFRLPKEDLTVKLLGLVQPPGAMTLNRLVKGLLRRELGHEGGNSIPPLRHGQDG